MNKIGIEGRRKEREGGRGREGEGGGGRGREGGREGERERKREGEGEGDESFHIPHSLLQTPGSLWMGQWGRRVSMVYLWLTREAFGGKWDTFGTSVL